jgi:hypothetical protein
VFHLLCLTLSPSFFLSLCPSQNWSQVNYINAYGCDAVPSEYVVISKDDPQPRDITVISGKMFLFLCDEPYARPYLSAFIFTSFVVLTGFMLISLTVAAVSGGVHLRLEQIQKQQHDHDEEEEGFDLDEAYMSTVTDDNVSRPPPPLDGSPKISRTLSTESEKKDPLHRIIQMESFQESSDADDSSSDESKKGKESVSHVQTVSVPITKISKQDSSEVQEFVRDISSSKSSDPDDSVIIRPVSEASAKLTLASLEQDIDSPYPSPQLPPVKLITNSPIPSSAGTPSGRKTVIGGRKTIRGSPNLPRPIQVKEELPLLQDKDLIRMILKQMWSDVENQKEKKLEEECSGAGDGSEEKQIPSRRRSSTASMTPLQDSHKPTRFLQSSIAPGHNRPQSQSQLNRSVSLQNPEMESSTSPKQIAYLLRNIWSTYYYIGYIILLILGTATIEIVCTNNNNCRNYWGFFVAVQILLSIDILVRVFTYFPTYQTFFLSHQNLFDLGMVLIIWIPIFYTGEGTQIAGE